MKDFIGEMNKALTAVESAAQLQPVAGLHPEWVVLTKAGLLYITLFENWVAMRFDDAGKAKQILSERTSLTGFNKHSGKWNYHPLPHEAEPVRKFMDRLQIVLPDMAERETNDTAPSC